MNDNEHIVNQLRGMAATDRPAVEILTWLRDTLGGNATFFRFSSCLFLAFDIPLASIRELEAWEGLGSGGTVSDQDAARIVGALIPRSGAVIDRGSGTNSD